MNWAYEKKSRKSIVTWPPTEDGFVGFNFFTFLDCMVG